MTLLSRLCVLLAVFSSATALPQYREAKTARATTETCINDTYTACGGGLPSNFCCSAGTTCIVSYGLSSTENTTAICCPKGSDCTYIVPMGCNVQMYNVTAYPESPILSTDLDEVLDSCGSQCCPPGYVCKKGACFLSAGSFEAKIGVITATAAESPTTTTISLTQSPTSFSTLTSSRLRPSTTSAPATSTASSAAAFSCSATTVTGAVTSPLKSRAVIAGAVIGALASTAIIATCFYFRQHLPAGWRRFISLFSSILPRSSSARSTRSSSSSVRYDTDETSQPHPQLQDPAPTWGIPLTSEFWWEHVRRKYPGIRPPWQSPRQPSKQPPHGSSGLPSSGSVLPRSHTLSTTFTTPLSSVGLPISQYNAHHEPETGIVTSPPSRSAARFAAKQQLKAERKAAKAAKMEETTKAAKKICNRLSSGFYRFKTLPPLPQSASPLLQSNFAAAALRPDMAAADNLYGEYGSSEQIAAAIGLKRIDGSPALVGSSTPQSTQSSDSFHSYFNGGKARQAEVEREHNTPLLPMPPQPRLPRQTDTALWPQPLRLSRHSSANGYSSFSAAGRPVEHGRSISDTPPRQQHLGAENQNYYHQQYQRRQITKLPSVCRHPLSVALHSLPSQVNAAAASSAPSPRPPRLPLAPAIPQSTRGHLDHLPRRSMTPVELPATPVMAHMRAATISSIPMTVPSNMPINAFGIISGGGGGEDCTANALVQRQMPGQQPILYYELSCSVPVCPYPDAGNPISLPSTPPPTRSSIQDHSRNPSRPLHPAHPHVLPSLITEAPPVLPPIPVISAIRARFQSSSPLSAVIHQQQMQQQHSPFPTQPPTTADVETPMSYQSQLVMSPISPTTPRIEEAQVQRLPRMAQARLMEQHPQPGIAIVVHPPPSEAPRSTRSSPQIYI